MAWAGPERTTTLPKLPDGACAYIEEDFEKNSIVVRVRTSNGQWIAFVEPADEFPSDTMIAQVVLVA